MQNDRIKPIKIGTFTLPFTPGIIPKNQSRLAESIGTTISKDLLTEEDLKNVLLSDTVKNEIRKKHNENSQTNKYPIVLQHGNNPGLVSHFVKAGMEYIVNKQMLGHKNYLKYRRLIKENKFNKLAQELGYAEANPSADIDGYDVQNKIVISSALAYNATIDMKLMNIWKLLKNF